MNEADKKKYLKHIAVLCEYNKSLDCCTLAPLRTLPLAIFCFVAGALFTLLFVCAARYDSPLWALAGVIPLISFGSGIVIIIGAKNKRKQIYLWLDDMTECLAQTETISSNFNFIPFVTDFLTTDCFIKIDFEHNEEKITKFAKGTKGAFTQYVGQYSDREIRILYSRKYDKILILKDTAPEFSAKKQ